MIVRGHQDVKARLTLTFFFFQAEDGIRDTSVTGVQTCALQILFTEPGERVNRPDFGCGVGQLVFMPNSDALAAATQFLVQGALTRWLDAIIAVQRVEILAAENVLTVAVVFTKRSTGEMREERILSPWRV